MHVLSSVLTTLLFLGYMVLWRIKKNELKKSSGIDPDVIGKTSRPIQVYFGHLQRIMTFSVVILILVHLFFTDSYYLLRQTAILKPEKADILGFVIGICGLSLCRIAQITMGTSWRVGIDDTLKAGLVTIGIYKYVRNPTYTGMYILCAGVLVINPTVLFSWWVGAFFLMMEFQVRCEEEYLENNHGDAYKVYRRSTKRYVPYIC